MSAADKSPTKSPANGRLSTGDPALDERLGGGFLPGTLTLLVGATGIGKTQLGLRFADAGRAQEGRRGILFDMTQRGDAQGHTAYAQRLSALGVPVTAHQQAGLPHGFLHMSRLVPAAAAATAATIRAITHSATASHG